MRKLFIIGSILLVILAVFVAATITVYDTYFEVTATGDSASECAEAASTEANEYCNNLCIAQGYDGGTANACHGTYSETTQTCRYTCDGCKCFKFIPPKVAEIDNL